MNFGKITGIQINKKEKNNCRPKDGTICIKIECNDTSISYGRHFEDTDLVVSKVK